MSLIKQLPFKVGDEIKNYKEMCRLLGEKEREGNSRKSQLSRWKEHFDWEKNGHKFKIVKVLNESFPTHDNNRIGQGIKPHSEELQSILLHFLKAHHSKFHSYWLTISMKGLVNLTQLFRSDFHDIMHIPEATTKASNKFNVKEGFIHDFYNRVYTTTTNDIKTALKQLEQKNVLAVEEIYMGRPVECLKEGLSAEFLPELQKNLNDLNLNDMFIAYVNHFGVISNQEYQKYNNTIKDSESSYNLRALEPFETSVFLGVREQLLKSWEYESLNNVYRDNQTTLFYKQLNSKLQEVMKMKYIFKGYRIIFLPYVIEHMETFNSFTLEDEKLKTLQNIFQEGFKGNIQKNYETRLKRISAKNTQLSMFMFDLNAEVCDLENLELSLLDRILLSVDNMELVIQEMLDHFMKNETIEN